MQTLRVIFQLQLLLMHLRKWKYFIHNIFFFYSYYDFFKEIENPLVNMLYVYSLLANRHQHATISAKYKPLQGGFV